MGWPIDANKEELREPEEADDLELSL